MKTIIAGSRTIINEKLVFSVIEKSEFEITEVVSGCCRGVDTIGEKWAKEKGLPIKKFPAQWDKFGRAAGPIRNEQMANYADQAIVIYIEDSKGAKNMIKQMKKIGKPVYTQQAKIGAN